MSASWNRLELFGCPAEQVVNHVWCRLRRMSRKGRRRRVAIQIAVHCMYRLTQDKGPERRHYTVLTIFMVQEARKGGNITGWSSVSHFMCKSQSLGKCPHEMIVQLQECMSGWVPGSFRVVIWFPYSSHHFTRFWLDIITWLTWKVCCFHWPVASN